MMKENMSTYFTFDWRKDFSFTVFPGFFVDAVELETSSESNSLIFDFKALKEKIQNDI